MQKRIAVITNDNVPHDAVVLPGTTPTDLRRSLGLGDDFLLSKRDGLPFGDAEDVYGLVREGEKVYATPPAVVGIH
ncbi:MAG: hypothetical protein IT434_11725 [Phycisphaerales bacterium]|nr:hypothetical protein [Phycisphaerales bacterium]